MRATRLRRERVGEGFERCPWKQQMLYLDNASKLEIAKILWAGVEFRLIFFVPTALEALMRLLVGC